MRLRFPATRVQSCQPLGVGVCHAAVGLFGALVVMLAIVGSARGGGPSAVAQAPPMCQQQAADGWCDIASPRGYSLAIPPLWREAALGGVPIYVSPDGRASVLVTVSRDGPRTPEEALRTVLGAVRGDGAIRSVREAAGAGIVSATVPGADAAVIAGLTHDSAEDGPSFELFLAATRGDAVYLLQLGAPSSYLAGEPDLLERMLRSFALTP